MTIGSHQATVGKSQEHLTPKWIIDRLGPFDLDPCAARIRPWNCAAMNYCADGLSEGWGRSRIWMNPPFDRYQVGKWIQRLADHGHGTALLHARTETDWFRPAWERASALLFMFQRIKFYRIDGTEQEANSGAPVVLLAFGDYDARRLRTSGIPGALIGPRDIITGLGEAAE